jgi:hypothetical protein
MMDGATRQWFNMVAKAKKSLSSVTFDTPYQGLFVDPHAGGPLYSLRSQLDCILDLVKVNFMKLN